MGLCNIGIIQSGPTHGCGSLVCTSMQATPTTTTHTRHCLEQNLLWKKKADGRLFRVDLSGLVDRTALAYSPTDPFPLFLWPSNGVIFHTTKRPAFGDDS